MITKEQYLESLNIVETYHEQLRQSSIGHRLTPITEWDKFEDCSRRLQNVLIDINKGCPSYYKEEFIENIKIDRMKSVRNCGKKSLIEFIELRGY